MHGSGDSDDDAGPVASYPDVRRGTRCSLSGSCPRIAQRSWAFRRRSPADPAVRPALHLGAHAVSPARIATGAFGAAAPQEPRYSLLVQTRKESAASSSRLTFND